MGLRILLADDHEIFRHGLRALIQTQRVWEVVGEAETGRQAVKMAAELNPDIAVLDVSMPELNGIEAARQIIAAVPECQVLILTLHESDRLVRELVEMGVRGYVLKSDAKRDLLAALEALSKNKRFFTPIISEIVVDSFLERREGADENPTRLTPREREVVQLLSEGKSNKEVATALRISVKTVEAHRTHIMAKLNLGSLSELVRYAVRNHIIQA